MQVGNTRNLICWLFFGEVSQVLLLLAVTSVFKPFQEGTIQGKPIVKEMNFKVIIRGMSLIDGGP